MTEHDPIKNDARRARRQAQLGPGAVCVICGHDQWVALTRVSRSLLEQHHVVGRATDGDVTVPLCRNCHAKITEDLRQCGASMAKARTVLDKLVAILRALGAFCVMLGQKMGEWAEELAAFILKLDRMYPSWRAMPEAS